VKKWYTRLLEWLLEPVLQVGVVSTTSTKVVGGIHTEARWIDTVNLGEADDDEDDCPKFLKSPFSG
jgi:hypothetical protein